MSQYRDDDEAARARIAALESALRERDAEIQHLKHERSSAPDPREIAEASPYAVPTHPQYVPSVDERSPYAPPGEPSPYAPPGQQFPAGPMQPPAPLRWVLGIISGALSHLVALFGFVLGFHSCLGDGSCSAGEAKGHIYFVNSGWLAAFFAVLAIVVGMMTLRKVHRLGPGYRRGVLSIVIGALGFIGTTVMFLMAAITDSAVAKRGEAWWTPKFPDSWF